MYGARYSLVVGVGDGEMFLASMAFLSSALFFGIHGLATPGVLVPERGAGFVLSAPVGMAIAPTGDRIYAANRGAGKVSARQVRARA